MITVEKDAKAEEIFIHASPEELRGFAKKLWSISEKAEVRGEYKEQLSPKDESDIELLTTPHQDPRTHGIVTKLTISCSTKL